MQEDTPDRGPTASGGGLSMRHIVVIAVVAVVVGALVIYALIRKGAREDLGPGKAKVAVVPEGSRSVGMRGRRPRSTGRHT